MRGRGLVGCLMIMWAAPAAAQSLPYSPEAVAQELGMPVPRFEAWWSQAPASLRAHLAAQPLEKWGSAVICDYLGYRAGTQDGDTCREDRYTKRMQSADQWNPDGTYRGPSEECLARNKTDKWGRLICN